MFCSCKTNVAFGGGKYNGAVVEMAVFLSNLRLETPAATLWGPDLSLQTEMDTDYPSRGAKKTAPLGREGRLC